MSILVTGAAGFIGSHVVERLLEKGHTVRALARYTSSGDIGFLSKCPDNLKSGLEIVFGDVRDSERMCAVLQGCEAVLHLGALIAIPYSYHAPRSYVETNLVGTLNVLEAARKQANFARVVIVSTSEVYGTAKQIPISESHPLNAQSPYAATKTAADQLALSYYQSFDLPVTVVRPFNTFGPRQSARAVVPTILSQLLSGKTTIRLGALHPTRDLTFVKDTASGLIDIGLHPDSVGQTIQLGTGKEISIGALATRCAALCDVDLTIETDETRVRPAKGEVERLVSDPSKAKAVCGWEALTSLDDGLQETAMWIKENLHRFSPDEYRL